MCQSTARCADCSPVIKPGWGIPELNGESSSEPCLITSQMNILIIYIYIIIIILVYIILYILLVYSILYSLYYISLYIMYIYIS